MLYKVRNAVNKRIYDARCDEIFRTPSIPKNTDDVVILSAVGNRDLAMYLVAIKSFYRAFGRGRIAVLVPDNYPDSSLAKLIEHVNPFTIIRDGEVAVGKCPRGGTWERLVSIVKMLDADYVIQLDADTVTCGDIPEVINCVKLNKSFTIGTWSNQRVEDMASARAHVLRSTSSHVQILAEKNFDKLSSFSTAQYVRGQSSFAGFARRGFSIAGLEKFSSEMVEILGEEKWNEWGSESLASNYIVANSGDSVVLPFPKYSGYAPGEGVPTGRSFVHFEGTHRFKGGRYVQASLEAIAALNDGSNALSIK